jgi:hypothetical protein
MSFALRVAAVFDCTGKSLTRGAESTEAGRQPNAVDVTDRSDVSYYTPKRRA